MTSTGSPADTGHNARRGRPTRRWPITAVISLAAGVGAGVIYFVLSALVNMQLSPVPPLVALVGLSGIFVGERGGRWLIGRARTRGGARRRRRA